MAILSIQSFVSYGHVGNSAALLPLYRQGFDVWPVPTAVLAHHPGHGRPPGHRTPPDEVMGAVEALGRLGVLGQCRGLLSGWLGAPANVGAVERAVATVRAANSRALYLCDPVMGDRDEGIYVDPALPDLFRQRLLPMADIATPNQFELEHLTGGRIATLGEALEALRRLRAWGVGTAICTSLVRADRSPGEIETLAMDGDGAWIAATPILHQAPHGAGDMFAALFLARTINGDDVRTALGFATGAVYGVLAESVRLGRNEPVLVPMQEELVKPSFAPKVERVA